MKTMLENSSRNTGSEHLKAKSRLPLLIIKVGGGKSINWEGVARDSARLLAENRIIIVHGANALRKDLASRLGIPVQTVVSPSGVSSVLTDKEAIDVMLMAYSGLANKRAVETLRRFGVNAVGLSGLDGELWTARGKPNILVREGKKTKLIKDNLTGRVEKVNRELLDLLLDFGATPVISAPALSFEGVIVNTDNDFAAAVMAAAMDCRRMVSLFEAPGMLRNPKDKNSLISRINRSQLESLIHNAEGRMKKKILGAKKALESGVRTIYWGDGRVEGPVLKALEGRGTVIE